MAVNNTYRTDQNMGLPCQFVLTKGAFTLVGGQPKCDDAITMLLSFIGWFRVYYPDFIPDMLWLLQKPTSIVNSLTALILSKLKKSIEQNVLFVLVTALNVTYVPAVDRKTFTFQAQYNYTLGTTQQFLYVSFITINS